MRLLRAAAGAAALVLAAAACSGDDGPEGRSGGPRVERPPVIDYSGAALAKVPGTTTTVGLPETGSARILGSVAGPGGLIPGATVRIEHLVGGGAVVHDVVTGPDGKYVLDAIPGGRYRVRAFLAPALGMLRPETRFLQDGKEATFDLVVEDLRKVVARAATSPSVPYVDEAVNLSAVVATQQVDVDGIVRSTPVPGLRVELTGLGAWVLRSDSLRTPFDPRGTTTTTSPQSALRFTDAYGAATWELRCQSAGASGLGLLVSVTVTPPAVEGQPAPFPEQRTERLELELPDCVDPTATTNPFTGQGDEPSATTSTTQDG
jgi:hypothetical protein